MLLVLPLPLPLPLGLSLLRPLVERSLHPLLSLPLELLVLVLVLTAILLVDLEPLIEC